MLAATHLRKDFASIRAVDDVSFHVRAGQVFGLIGPNGAGKSTTIRMLMDILQPDAGSIEIDGRPAAGVVRALSGYLPEERGLYRKSRVGSVIEYFAALKGLTRREARVAAAPWLERFGLDGRANRNVEELSKGNQQKLQFIIAVLHRPRLLVLDELFSGLDPVNQELMKDALFELRGDNRAIVFSTHMMEHAERLCDELVLIDHGRIVLEGTPGDIKRRHGRNAVQVEFDGDGAFLAGLPGVRTARIAGRAAELELADGADDNALLAGMLPRLRVARFARVEPSLHAIFIDTVGAPEGDTGDGAPPPPPQAVSSRAVLRQPRVWQPLALSLLLAVLALAVALRPEAGNAALLQAAAFVTAAVFVFLRYQRAKRAARRALETEREERS